MWRCILKRLSRISTPGEAKMKFIVKSIMQLGMIYLICFGLFNLQPASAEGNIDTTYKYAWSENSGWKNFRPTHGGVTINPTYLSGYAWAENIGWVKLGSGTGPYDNTTSANWGVNHDSATGALSGYAWSENVGWINFNVTGNNPNGVSIDTGTLKFNGYAWAENVGYVHFRNTSPEYFVMLEGGLPTGLTASTPSLFKSSVKKVEMLNGTSWVTIFSGTAQLDVKTVGIFPGVSDLSLAAGTYSQIKLTFDNAFPVAGTLNYGGTAYYTTAATFGGQTNLASTPTTVDGSMAEFTFYNPAWGALNADVTQTFSITPITVGPATDCQPTLRFTISDKLVLNGNAGTPATYYFSLSAPIASLIEP
jgi:hypothetical protein